MQFKIIYLLIIVLVRNARITIILSKQIDMR